MPAVLVPGEVVLAFANSVAAAAPAAKPAAPLWLHHVMCLPKEAGQQVRWPDQVATNPHVANGAEQTAYPGSSILPPGAESNRSAKAQADKGEQEEAQQTAAAGELAGVAAHKFGWFDRVVLEAPGWFGEPCLRATAFQKALGPSGATAPVAGSCVQHWSVQQTWSSRQTDGGYDACAAPAAQAMAATAGLWEAESMLMQHSEHGPFCRNTSASPLLDRHR